MVAKLHGNVLHRVSSSSILNFPMQPTSSSKKLKDMNMYSSTWNNVPNLSSTLKLQSGL